MIWNIQRDLPGAIFDLDGTLLDSMGIWQQIDIAFLGKRGIPLPEDYQEAITPLGARAAAEYTIRRFSLPDTPEELMREWYDMAFAHYRDTLQLKSGAGDYVRRLSASGKKLAIATSSHREMVVAALQRTGLYEMMDAIVTVAEVSRGKGFPDIYEACAAKLGLAASECVVYEDIIEGIRGARAGGFVSVGVYEPIGPDQEQMRMEADHYICSFAELMK